jgi:carbamoyltransferase
MSRPADVEPMTNVYFGPQYSDDDIEDVLAEIKLDYRKSDDVVAAIAQEIADGSLVGWFQGRLEVGPRALGNRSILADPRSVESRDNVNKYVKHREEWRPFAPSMKEEAVDEYLVDATQSPFMIKTYDVREDKQGVVPALLHAGDGTTRPQTVNAEQNPRYYALLSEFENLTGIPMLLNTSFNDHGEPIVNRPSEAIKDFYGMGLDVLVLGDYVLEK